jgi:hypothetical protein
MKHIAVWLLMILVSIFYPILVFFYGYEVTLTKRN